MNKIFFCCFLLLAQFTFAQSPDNTTSSEASTAFKAPPLDKSPMDMVYFPANYPVLRVQDKASEPLVARVIYSRPQKEGRNIFGELVEWGKIWRFGANEATEFEVYRDVKIKDKKLPKGRYTLYAIPTEKQWTVIFNKDTDIWGSFKYDEKKDMLRVDVPVQKNSTPIETFTILFTKTTNGADMLIAWDNAMATLPISFK